VLLLPAIHWNRSRSGPGMNTGSSPQESCPMTRRRPPETAPADLRSGEFVRNPGVASIVVPVSL